MEIKDYRAFLTVADTLHFGRASQICHVSASTLSRQIQRIEEQLGHTLFIRGNRQVTLTVAGERFRQHAEQSLQNWRALERDLSAGKKDIKGVLQIYCSVTASSQFLLRILNAVRERHPAIELRVHTGDEALSIKKVMAGEEDVAIAAKPDVRPTSLLFNTLARSALVLIAPNFSCPVSVLLDTEKDINWNEIPFILSEKGLSRYYAEQWFASQSIKPHLYAEVAGHEAIVGMVALGLGVGVVPELVLEQNIMRDKLRIIDAKQSMRAYHIGLCVKESGLDNPTTRAFWDCAMTVIPKDI